LAKHRSESAAYKAYREWGQYDSPDQQQLQQWQNQYGLSDAEFLSDNELRHLQRITEEAEINFTPLISVDDHELVLDGMTAAHALGRWMRKYHS